MSAVGMRKGPLVPEMEAKAVRGGDTLVISKPKPPEHHVRDQGEGRGCGQGARWRSICQSPPSLTRCSLLVNTSVYFSPMGEPPAGSHFSLSSSRVSLP